MSQVYLDQLAGQRIGYLSSRQSLIAGNVANANTPGFAARDLKPFSAALQETALTMTTTNPAHITPAAAETGDPPRSRDSDDAEVTVSGNSVEVEAEMVKLGEVNRDFQQATSIKRAFHQMMMQALK